MYKKDYCCCTGTVHCRYCIRAGKPAHLTVDKDYNTVLIDYTRVFTYAYGSTIKQRKEPVKYDAYGNSIREPINELENMSTPLRTQQEAINAIKLGNYMVVSVSGTGDWSMSPSPSAHANTTSARAECARLARLNPGKMFSFIKLAGAELVPANTISI